MIMGILFGLINITALVVASVKPAGFGRMVITERIQQMQNGSIINLITYESSNPYDPWGGDIAGFYLPSAMHFRKIDSLKEINADLLKDGERNLLVLREKDVRQPEVIKQISNLGFTKIEQSIPSYLIPFLKIYGSFHTDDILYLYESG